eukprot:NODE_9_length_64580_cov_1.431941.p55 type:complete len:100 gc:universal NODE_9_length_64580_cov_1.431941:44043-44342(+)
MLIGYSTKATSRMMLFSDAFKIWTGTLSYPRIKSLVISVLFETVILVCLKNSIHSEIVEISEKLYSLFRFNIKGGSLHILSEITALTKNISLEISFLSP